MINLKIIKDSQILYQARHLTIIHAPSHKVIFYKLSGYVDEAEAYDFFNNILLAIEKTGERFIIADLSDFKGSNLNLAKYANQVWMAKVAHRGITHIAMNTPKSEFGAFTSRIAAGRKAHSLIKFRSFKDLNEAFSWFQEERKKA